MLLCKKMTTGQIYSSIRSLLVVSPYPHGSRCVKVNRSSVAPCDVVSQLLLVELPNFFQDVPFSLRKGGGVAEQTGHPKNLVSGPNVLRRRVSSP